MLLSIVIPCFNEEATLPETISRIEAVLKKIDSYSFELIFVDDGSKDKTKQILVEKCKVNKKIKIVSFSRNFGHQFALDAGITNASGDAIIIMDADLQDPPEVIPKMIAKWVEGFDVVYAVRSKREGESWFKKYTAYSFYRIQRFLSDIEIPADTGDFRLISRRIADLLVSLPEKDKFFRGLIPWLGFKQGSITYDRHERFAGTTKYTLSQMTKLGMSGLLSFSTKPLTFFTTIGAIISLLSFVGIIHTLWAKFFTDALVDGWATLMIVILFIGGVQLIAVGVLGEYLGRVFAEVKDRPKYIIDEKIGF
jgi:polyisoprenyl-phosphate glycosyltransferase